MDYSTSVCVIQLSIVYIILSPTLEQTNQEALKNYITGTDEYNKSCPSIYWKAATFQ